MSWLTHRRNDVILLKVVDERLFLKKNRYPTELEKAIELHVDFIKGTADSSEGGTNQKALKWTTELISFALTMVKSQVSHYQGLV